MGRKEIEDLRRHSFIHFRKVNGNLVLSLFPFIYPFLMSAHTSLVSSTISERSSLDHPFAPPPPTLNLVANSAVKRTGSVVSTAITSARIWLLVLIFPPISVFQSFTSHSNPSVLIIDEPPTGRIPTFSSRYRFSLPPWCSWLNPLGVCIVFRPRRRRNDILSSEMR